MDIIDIIIVKRNVETFFRRYHDVNVGTRGQQVKKTEAELFELYKDPI